MSLPAANACRAIGIANPICLLSFLECATFPKRRVILLLLLTLSFLSGCETELETGYKPRPLNATSTDRRAYYAPPFTSEATPPAQDKSGGEGLHRPGNY